MVQDHHQLDEIVSSAAESPRYAIDTEFHRERTYFPQVALVQLAWDDEVELIDPLAVDIGALATLLEGDGLCVLHAGVQDLEVLELATGCTPRHLFDTQIAAGFLGVSNGSLASLLDRYLGVSLPKADRLSDWLRRPLTEAQLRYAASDVDRLLDLADVIGAGLEHEGRSDWADSECSLLLERPRHRRHPEDAINRLKEARSLRGPAYRTAASIAAWRERRAAALDMPVRQVLPDLAVVAIAQRAPTNPAKLIELRGVEQRHLRNGAAQEIIAAVREGKESTRETERPPRSPELPRHLRPVITLVMAWISQLARDHRLDPALLATRADVENLLRGGTDSRLHHGWRADLAGAPIAQLVAGDAAVAFDGDGRLVLEQRSGIALGSS
ncbi:MAG: ribonuclease D [Acidimicrobiales bacterium]